MNYLKNKEEKQQWEKLFKNYTSGVLMLYITLFSLFISCSDSSDVELSSISTIESFSFQSNLNANLDEDVVGTISDNNITLLIPYNVSANRLIATFTYSGVTIQIGGKEQASGVTVNSFDKPVVYTVVAENGTKVNYTVTVTNKSSGIPSVYINTEGGAPILDKENYVEATIKIDGDGKYDNFEGKTSIRGRGNSTWEMPKKPYKLKLDKEAPLFGMNSHREWAVLANYFDKTFLRNITAFEISRIAEMSWTPSSVSFELYLNEAYQGVYAMTEQVRVSKERFDIELVKPTDISGEALTGGYFLELDFHFDETYKFKTERAKLPIMFKDPKKPTVEQFNYVQSYYNLAEEVLYSENYKDSENGYRKYIDVESFINYYIVQELSKNVDGNMRGSCFMAIRRNGKIEQPLVWDFDLAFGNADYITWEQGATSAGWDGWYIKTCSPWFDRLFEDPQFVEELKDRWNELKPQLDKLPSFIKEHALMLDDAQTRNFSTKETNGAGWDINKVDWNTSRVSGSYKAEINYLVTFVEKRIGWLDSNINKLN